MFGSRGRSSNRKRNKPLIADPRKPNAGKITGEMKRRFVRKGFHDGSRIESERGRRRADQGKQKSWKTRKQEKPEEKRNSKDWGVVVVGRSMYVRNG